MKIACLFLIGCAAQVQASKSAPGFSPVRLTASEVVCAGIAEDAQQAEQSARDAYAQFLQGALQMLDMQAQNADQPALTSVELSAVQVNAARVSLGKAENVKHDQFNEVRYRLSRAAVERAFTDGLGARKSKGAVVGATFDALQPASPAQGQPAETTR